jgi:hypothetical protein
MHQGQYRHLHHEVGCAARLERIKAAAPAGIDVWRALVTGGTATSGANKPQ